MCLKIYKIIPFEILLFTFYVTFIKCQMHIVKINST